MSTLLFVGQKEIKFSIAEMIGNDLTKQVVVAEEGVKRCREEELLALNVEME